MASVMAEELVGEEDVVDLSNTECNLYDKSSLKLVGRLLTERPFNFETMEKFMKHVWNLKEDAIVSPIGEKNLFLFEFFNRGDKDKVLDGRPWCFGDRLLILQETSAQLEPSQVILNHSPFWVRLYNLPFGYRSNESIKAISAAIGEVLEVEDDDYAEVEPFRRVKIMIDVTKPIKRFQRIRTKGGETVKIDIKYDKLPHFCCLCGMMSHTNEYCTLVTKENSELGFGWSFDLKASPLMEVRKPKMEAQDYMHPSYRAQKHADIAEIRGPPSNSNLSIFSIFGIRPYSFPPGRRDCIILWEKKSRAAVVTPCAMKALKAFNTRYGTDYELEDCLDTCCSTGRRDFFHFNFTAKPNTRPLIADDYSTKVFFAEIQFDDNGEQVSTSYSILHGIKTKLGCEMCPKMISHPIC
ncbi:unnamed protein product [Amaranthus hypochondriacus]